MKANHRRAISALNDELFALTVAIELLQKQPPDWAAILTKCESSVRRCQTIVASLSAPSDDGNPATIQ